MEIKAAVPVPVTRGHSRCSARGLLRTPICNGQTAPSTAGSVRRAGPAATATMVRSHEHRVQQHRLSIPVTRDPWNLWAEECILLQGRVPVVRQYPSASDVTLAWWAVARMSCKRIGR